MNNYLMRECNSGILSLFERMDSNKTKFEASVQSSPNLHKQGQLKDNQENSQSCNCMEQQKERKLQQSFYSNQLQLIDKALASLNTQDNDIFMKLLSFMSDYLVKICKEFGKETICSCKLTKIKGYNCLSHKINFLREENHKFFKLIEQKNEECQKLKEKIQVLQLNSKLQSEMIKGTNSQQLFPFLALLNEEISSRNISGNSSRISQFKHSWEDLSLPMGEGGHRKYFEIPSHEKHQKFDSGEILQQKNINIINQNYNKKPQFQNSFKKPKIF